MSNLLKNMPEEMSMSCWIKYSNAFLGAAKGNIWLGTRPVWLILVVFLKSNSYCWLVRILLNGL